jgi:peptide/nickel transport system substrate-binding protein
MMQTHWNRIMLWAAVVSTAVAVVSVACTTPTVPITPSAPAGAADQGPAKPKVDRVVMAVEPPAREGNEGRHQSAPDNWQLKPIYEYLIGMKEDEGKMIPELATDWTLQPDGKSFLFNLRKGVQFHNGYGEFTSKDLLPTAAEIVKEDSLAGASPFWRLVLDSIEPQGDYQALVKFRRPDGNGLTSISRFRGGFEIFSKADFDKNGPAVDLERGPIAGTGPYQFQLRMQAQYLRYQRVASKHWRAAPDFSEFEFRFVKEPSTRMAALVSGEVHMADLPQDLRDQAKQRGYKGIVARDPSLRTSFHIMGVFLNDRTERTPNPDASKGWLFPDSPMMDVRIRKALSKAIDRNALNKAFFGGQGKLMYNPHFTPSRLGWDPAWERRYQEEYGYDVEAAKKLLADAGYGPSKQLTTTLLVAKAYGYSGAEDLVEAVAGMYRAIGINAVLQPIDSAQLTPMQRAWSFQNHLSINGTGSDQWTGVTTYGSTQGSRTGGVELPEANKILEQIGNTLDPKKQDELWRQAGEIIFTQHKEVPLFWLPIEAIVDPKIVADWTYPGSATGSWTHVENIRAAR